MESDGVFYLTPEEDFPAFFRLGLRHSSAPRGKPLAAAGIVKVSKFSTIDSFKNRTGHYWKGFRLPEINWKQFLHSFSEQGDRPDGVLIIEGNGDPMGWREFQRFYPSEVSLSSPR